MLVPWSALFGWDEPWRAAFAQAPGQTLLFPANLTDTISLQDFTAGLHADFDTGTHWRSQLSSSETYFREFNFDSFSFNRIYFSCLSTVNFIVLN